MLNPDSKEHLGPDLFEILEVGRNHWSSYLLNSMVSVGGSFTYSFSIKFTIIFQTAVTSWANTFGINIFTQSGFIHFLQFCLPLPKESASSNVRENKWIPSLCFQGLLWLSFGISKTSVLSICCTMDNQRTPSTCRLLSGIIIFT